MKVSKVIPLNTEHMLYDIVTETENFFVKMGGVWGLIHNSPAVYLGINPENGKFFVATKSLFNKTPKINYTDQDIKNNHGGGLVSILSLVLKYGKELGIKSGIFQGDLMFTPDIKKKTSINGESHWIFQPNTIAYAVPTNSDLGSAIGKAKIGIVFHTEYTGNTITGLTANYNINPHRQLKKSRNVFWMDAYFKDVSGTATFTASESASLNKELRNVGKMGRNLKDIMNKISKNANVSAAMSQYINSKVRNAPTDAISVSYNVTELLAFATETMKTPQAKRELISSFIYEYKYDIGELFDLHRQVATVKLAIVRKLASVQSMKHFLTKGDDLVVTGPEGFVAIDHIGNALKLVDRMSFSKANFACRG